MNNITKPRVSLAKCIEARYPIQPPFSPSEIYPELVFLSGENINQQEENQIYAAVRQSMKLAGWDSSNYGTEKWNPLGVFVQPGSRILLKPNWVLHEYSHTTKDCLITNGAVIRAVLDYTYRAGGPTCHITIADAPEQAADFECILAQTGIMEIVAFYRDWLNFNVEVYDLRTVASDWNGKTGYLPPARQLSGDPLGYIPINLGSESELEQITRPSTRFGIAQYSLDSLQERHKPARHEYMVSRTMIEADTVISLPKMKTHQKTGLTGGLKNFVGINGCKDWLPHYREGSTRSGGDEHPDGHWMVSVNRTTKKKLQRKNPFMWHVAYTVWHAIRPFLREKSQLPSGAWYGNDTLWRMIIDLNRIVMFADRDGRLSEHPQRQTCFIVDGVIAGQGDGPLSPIAKPAGVILAGDDVVAIDIVLAQLMGYDWRKIPLLAHFLSRTGTHQFTQFDEDVQVITSDGVLSFEELETMDFIPPPGWIGHIENKP